MNQRPKRGSAHQEPRYRNIPVSRHERAEIEGYREQLEKVTGPTPDWGVFLRTAMLLALVQAGVYMLGKVLEQVTPQQVTVQCPSGHSFPLAFQGRPSGAVQIVCPHCGMTLVITFTK
jgi:hypothetical protein